MTEIPDLIINYEVKLLTGNSIIEYPTLVLLPPWRVRARDNVAVRVNQSIKHYISVYLNWSYSHTAACCQSSALNPSWKLGVVLKAYLVLAPKRCKWICVAFYICPFCFHVVWTILQEGLSASSAFLFLFHASLWIDCWDRHLVPDLVAAQKY